MPGPIGSWTLTTSRYGDTILAVVRALGLDRPILLGASMAGEVCLEMAYRAPEAFRGVIACGGEREGARPDHAVGSRPTRRHPRPSCPSGSPD
ncbi:alpha/beta fold hydrolase [Pseudonocardia kunmingensis]|uniref:alpha/beta fold hydrolase n=1 Tax=Pseudonocardia kunmingensis TaxID=630975 RepID=UPI001479839E